MTFFSFGLKVEEQHLHSNLINSYLLFLRFVSVIGSRSTRESSVKQTQKWFPKTFYNVGTHVVVKNHNPDNLLYTADRGSRKAVIFVSINDTSTPFAAIYK